MSLGVNFRHTCSAWIRLAKATREDTDVITHEAAFGGLGRWVVKTESISGDLDKGAAYSRCSNQIIETRSGSATWKCRCMDRAIHVATEVRRTAGPHSGPYLPVPSI